MTDAFVSTGALPSPEAVQAAIDEAYERFGANAEGAVSNVYPALARVPADLFGICVVSTEGNAYAVGDAEREFTIMSVSKPFVFALVCERLGPAAIRDRIGVNATGLPFNSLGPSSAARTGGRTRWSTRARSRPRAWPRGWGISCRKASRASLGANSSWTRRSTRRRRRRTTATRASRGC